VAGASQPQPRLTGIQAKATLTWALRLKSEENGNMKKITFIITTALCLLLALKVSTANAQTQKDPCANAQTQVEMNECQGREYKKADAALNAVYKQLMAKIDTEGERAALKAAQVAWIKYRDADCEFVSYLNKGGTIYPLVYSGCLTARTQERTKQLREVLKDR
jgi:uncharacterized protein YecT (DUF1311 family)